MDAVLAAALYLAVVWLISVLALVSGLGQIAAVIRPGSRLGSKPSRYFALAALCSLVFLLLFAPQLDSPLSSTRTVAQTVIGGVFLHWLSLWVTLICLRFGRIGGAKVWGLIGFLLLAGLFAALPTKERLAGEEIRRDPNRSGPVCYDCRRLPEPNTR